MGLDYEFFAELDAYEARAEYEAWLDDMEEEFTHMQMMNEQELIPEVIE